MSARDSVGRARKPLWLRQVNVIVLQPTLIIDDINGVSNGIRLFAFPSAPGFALFLCPRVSPPPGECA